jgi:hypothetical protein
VLRRPEIACLLDRRAIPAIEPARVSNNPWQESVSAWLLFPMFFDTQRPGGLPILQAFSSCTSRIHLMVGLPSLRYPWNLTYANCP